MKSSTLNSLDVLILHGSFHTFREVPRFRILVCGGDGTVGWVLGVLEAVRHKLVCREPPIGIVPLGTGETCSSFVSSQGLVLHGLWFVSSGNDLARVLRWGAGYSCEDPHSILVSVDEADEVLMDRWTILLDAQDISEDSKDHNYLEPPKVCSGLLRKSFRQPDCNAPPEPGPRKRSVVVETSRGVGETSSAIKTIRTNHQCRIESGEEESSRSSVEASHGEDGTEGHAV